MLDVITAYEGAYHAFGDAAFGERAVGENHAVSLLSPQGEYTELGYFANKGIAHARSEFALTQVPTDAKHLRIRKLMTQRPDGPFVNVYRENSYDYMEGLDDWPIQTNWIQYHRTESQVTVETRRMLLGAVVLGRAPAVELMHSFRPLQSIVEYREKCQEALENTAAHLGTVTSELLDRWSTTQ